MSDRSPDLAAVVRDFLAHQQADRAPLAVAFSGGLDSTVLLHVLLDVVGSDQLRALHVDHGLQPESADWAEQCRQYCNSLGLECDVLAARLKPQPGDSVEALAREARYQLLTAALAADEQLVLAQHRRDQLETVLLALMRGSGLNGLAAMPASAERNGARLLRPLLAVDKGALTAFARARGLDWQEDPSNADERFDRNFLRQQVVPLLERRWPAASLAAARSSRHAADAIAVLDDCADDDLGDALQGSILDSTALQVLTAPRRRNALRRVCRRLGLPVPSEVQLAETLAALAESRADAEPVAAWPGVRIRRYRQHWCFYPEAADPGSREAARSDVWELRAGASLELGWPGGVLHVNQVKSSQAVAGLRAGVTAEVRFRQGGEALRPSRKGSTREFKKLLQEAAVFPWMREHIPLLYVDGELAAVADLWLNFDHPDVLPDGGLALQWSGHEPLAARL